VEPMRPRSIRVKLTLWLILIFAAIVSLSDYVIYQELKRVLRSELDSNLLAMASVESATYADASVLDPGAHPDAITRPGQTYRHFIPEFVQVVDSTGKVVSRAGMDEATGPLLDDDEIARVIRGATVRADGALQGRLVRLAAIGGAVRGENFVIVVGARTDSLVQTDHWILFILAIVDLAAIVVSAAVAYLIIGEALKPLDHIVERASEIGAGGLHQRLEKTDSSLEMARLTAVLNEMFDRLQRLFESQRRFTQDASHEIRSPLAAIRCRLEVALRQPREAEEYRRALEGCLQDVVRITGLAEDLFLLARADSDNLAMEFREVSLRELLAEVSDQLTALAETRRIKFSLHCESHCTVYADSMWLQRAFRNIIENALKYTPGGGSVNVTIKAQGDYVCTEIADTGVGIPIEEQVNIFRRFYRVDHSRSRGDGGTGLGLAICDRIVQAHHGRIEMESVAGQGTKFKVLLASAEALLEEAVV
jgi:heavy metal sensor kinase